MNDVQLKSQHLRDVRKQFDRTLAEVKPRLTIRGLFDEAVGQVMDQNRHDSVVSAFAVATAAWILNTVSAEKKLDKHLRSKTSTSKKGDTSL